MTILATIILVGFLASVVAAAFEYVNGQRLPGSKSNWNLFSSWLSVIWTIAALILAGYILS